ncbi:MAG: hypothetical protein RBQ71_04165 [Acholeplasmataceae bacterium]|nr:hypothetical protein [Acholeplasmataceae bacterium]
MDVIDWLLKGDSNISFLVKKHLLNQKLMQHNDGYIKNYLNQYNKETKMWGNGLYGPKWISSTYTLLDLISLEANIDQNMVDGYYKLRQELVLKYTLNPKDKKTLDLCIVGMLVKIGAYLNTDEDLLKELIDFILYTLNSDGAWNCYFNYRTYKTSSLHTTINILEGLQTYISNGYSYRKKEVIESMNSANEFILQKQLFRSRRTNEIIREQFLCVHYPTRWYYDMFRALEYFVDANVAYDIRMKEALDLIKKKLAKGYLPKGKTYAGKTHFKLNLEDYKRINTFSALRIVKKYDEEYYNQIIGDYKIN